MKTAKISETITENIFRKFYEPGMFIEKSAIPSHYGFKSKKKQPLKDILISLEMKKKNLLL